MTIVCATNEGLYATCREGPADRILFESMTSSGTSKLNDNMSFLTETLKSGGRKEGRKKGMKKERKNRTKEGRKEERKKRTN